MNSRSSTKRARCLPVPAEISTSSETPAKSTNGAHVAASNTSGTSAGRGSTMAWPNCLASRSPKSVAPILGTGRPPVATTTLRASTGPRPVSTSKRTPVASVSARGRTAVTEHGCQRSTRPSSHSRSSRSMMSWLDSSQNSCPRCFSWNGMRWRCTSAMKSCAV